MDQWDRFAEQNRDGLDDLGWDQTLDVYQPTESFTPGGGYDVSYPGTPTMTIDAEITRPESSGERDRGGTTTDADVVLFVPDNTGVAWAEFGDSGEAATRVEDVATGIRYEVENVDDEHNGLLRLEGTEV